MTPTWTLWAGDDAAWDATLASLNQHSVYQSSSWGRHKSHSGWEVIRVNKKSESAELAIQVLIRHAPLGVCIGWAPGGFAGDTSLLDHSFIASLKSLLGAKVVYLRCGMMTRATDAAQHRFLEAGLNRCDNAIGAQRSMLLTVDSDPETMLAKTSGNWKRNYKRSLRLSQTPYIWTNPQPTVLERAYQSMDEFKKVKNVTLGMSADDIRSVLNEFGDQLLLVRQDDEDGNVLSIRGALIHQNYAWDFIAVTTPQGRKNYSSHRTLIALASAAAERGCTLLELGGIDPVKNKGVFDFKQGTGAQEITYLGEWEQANPSWARWAISRIITAKAE
jgi:hypothetical protein